MWTQVVPFGLLVKTYVLDCCDDLINTVIEIAIAPIVTILHYDLPWNLPHNTPDFT